MKATFTAFCIAWDLSVFTTAPHNGSQYSATVYGNGVELQQAIEPLFEAYFSHARNDEVFTEMARK
ncbi:hypothetical protein GCM10010174_19010 [Kutzneria viridogrisea]|uniref:Uncharacterized protein n=2 Tax=Kutzneria TaxID=43356 RepID=W5WF99_9PSEU|nr:hypothetical protein [Kutzneria albida]AHH99522.1 hypothetical protein KALB_6162 [Kutzneria albida DSM 43870]MBA8922921.1 hypothetical protein [Kutzneria viridogrisea]